MSQRLTVSGLRIWLRRSAFLAGLLVLPPGFGACVHHLGVRAVTTEKPVVVYGASWCRYTNAAVSYLRGRSIPYVMIDVDARWDARDELNAKLYAAGMSWGGIPVIDIHGNLVVGFDESVVSRTLGQLDE